MSTEDKDADQPPPGSGQTAKPRRSRLGLAAAGAGLVIIGLVIGRGMAGPSGQGQAAAPGMEGAAGSGAGPGWRNPLTPAEPPCVRVTAEGIGDAVSADFASALAAAAPDWRVSTTVDPGACEPDVWIQVVADRFELTRDEGFDRYVTPGFTGAVASSARGAGETLRLGLAVEAKLDDLIESLAQNTAKELRSARPWRKAQEPRRPEPDGKSCVKLVNESEYRDDDEARRLLQAARPWYIVGGPTREDCTPDAWIAHHATTIESAAGRAGSVVAFAMATNHNSAPAIALTWAADEGRAGAQATNQLMQGAPSQLE